MLANCCKYLNSVLFILQFVQINANEYFCLKFFFIFKKNVCRSEKSLLLVKLKVPETTAKFAIAKNKKNIS